MHRKLAIPRHRLQYLRLPSSDQAEDVIGREKSQVWVILGSGESSSGWAEHSWGTSWVGSGDIGSQNSLKQEKGCQVKFKMQNIVTRERG